MKGDEISGGGVAINEESVEKGVQISRKLEGEDAVTDTTASALADQEVKAGVSSQPSPFVPRGALDMLPPQWKEVVIVVLMILIINTNI